MPKRKYSDPGYVETEYKEDISLQAKIDEYFDKCKEDNVYPDEAGMIIYLGICRDTLENYLSNENGKYPGFSTPIKNARLRRESMTVRDIYKSDSKEATGKIFIAKQPSNGGLIDRPVNDNSGLTIKVDLGGVNPNSLK
jgi:hypothetical protein